MKKKVLLIQGYIPHYRVPIFNKLGESSDIDLTIIHSGESVSRENLSFTEQVVSIRSIFGFKFQENVFSVSKDYDVVIGMFDLHWLSILRVFFMRRNIKFVFWGIGKGRNKIVNVLRRILYKKADALLLYTDNDKEFFSRGKYENIFIANNTLDIQNSSDSSLHVKNSFIFVGTLYPGKGLSHLIIAFSKLLRNPYKLVIVGDGSEMKMLVNLVNKLDLNENVVFKGFISDNDVLSNLYSNAICSVSPNQAGLSVLQSMAFGVPFITRRDAYSGGEKYNIIDNVTGLFYDSNDELYLKMQKIIDNEKSSRELGNNAFCHFKNNRSVDNMVSGFVDSINYVLKK